MCAVAAAVLLGAGGVAVFVTDNELGSLGLLVLGAVLLVLAVFGLVPMRLGYGGVSVDLGRLRAALDQVAAEPDSAARQALAGALAASLEGRRRRPASADEH